VLEDPGGEPLERLVGGPMEVRQFLRLAVGLSAALGRVHQSGLIHKDIKPAIIESQDARIGVIRKLSSTSPTWRVLPLNAS
jgi:serine/threonine protein kinase